MAPVTDQDAQVILGDSFVVFIIVFPVVVFLIFIVLVAFLFIFFLILFFVEVVGDHVQMNRVSLRNLQLGLTLRTTQNFSLFHFVFIHIDFRGTFGAADHGCILRWWFLANA
jgi:hypothetical protein